MSGGVAAPEASIVVCTRNRSTALAPALEAMLRLDPPFDWELLVVDNGSTDDTLAVAQAVVERNPGRVRLVEEAVVGLSAARNCGMRLARGRWIVFLDDDAEPMPGLLGAYAEALAGERVLCAGGPVEPHFTGPLPDWLEPGFLPYLSVWDRGEESHDLHYNEMPRGANMAFRREAFERFGDFDLRLGRRGRSLRSCEEIELGLRLERAGFRTVYVPGARVRHRVEAERLTPDWLVRRFEAQGFSEAIVDWKHFGLRGVRTGFQRLRQDANAVRRATAGGTLRRRAIVAQAAAYRRGAVYAALAVERWSPPAAGRRSGT